MVRVNDTTDLETKEADEMTRKFKLMTEKQIRDFGKLPLWVTVLIQLASIASGLLVYRYVFRPILFD